MMKPATIAAACTFALLPVGAVAGDWATQAPEAGTYEALVNVQSASSGCIDKAGLAFVGSMSFGGMSATTDYLRMLETGSNVSVAAVQTLTVKSGRGTTSPSGGLTYTGDGIGINSWNITGGTFSATITEIGSHAFVLQLKESYSGCSSETLNVSLVRIGANQ